MLPQIKQAKLEEEIKNHGEDGNSYYEFPDAKPAHESNEVFIQFAYNQALTDHLTYLKEQREIITNHHYHD